MTSTKSTQTAKPKRTKSKGHIALLLCGGGARAAYQVGVLKAIAHDLPRNTRIPFPILTGTSAGAINSTALAVYASCFHLGVKKLEWVWKNFSTSRVYRSDALGVFWHLSKGIGSGTQASYANKRANSWFNNQPLRKLLNELLDFKRIDQNILSGHLKALSVNASSYSTGDAVCFFQANRHIKPWRRSHRRGEKALINTEHLMASAAIPLVFPSIHIQQDYYGDGSVHQLAPLSPPIHLGAKKIFLIGMSDISQEDRSQIPQHHPSLGTITGHLLDTIFNEALNSDLERLERVNQTMALLDKDERKKVKLRKVETFQIKPSQSFNTIAAKHYEDMPKAIKMLLKVFGISADSESSIVSYLMFEKAYCSELIELGFKDAMAQIDDIKAFLELD
ncbi:patatin-like phospholipase family protein [Catenovulum sp. SM1970]|uniref:patatin-like phospholipase family protein n=1 Tax=Marinifaba aquimaris TaxID=2741323 RepID=UPI001573ABA5|nr:patatin-like phospholipase family protein [Marinifaba aquimaris]NTS77068.1 patatin-like phospholipase family protein [Marinifaba aquimaris]